VKKLIYAGANPNSKDVLGRKPIDMAEYFTD
jgi:hypothetical protein